MEILVMVVGLAVLAVASVLYGYDSRDLGAATDPTR